MTAINERERYARQISLPEIGKAGQKKLASSSVLLVGVGGLGSPAALYLAASGIGTLTLVDDDTVDLTNLQRQIVHTAARIGENKAASAAQTLHELNPETRVQAVNRRAAGESFQIDHRHIIFQCWVCQAISGGVPGCKLADVRGLLNPDDRCWKSLALLGCNADYDELTTFAQLIGQFR